MLHSLKLLSSYFYTHQSVSRTEAFKVFKGSTAWNQYECIPTYTSNVQRRDLWELWVVEYKNEDTI